MESARENYYNLLDFIKETMGCEALPSVTLKEKKKIKTQIAAFRHQTAMYQIYTKKIAEGKKQLKTKKLLYQHGKINKLEVLKQISTNEEMEYKRLESLYEINLSYYYLEYLMNQ